MQQEGDEPCRSRSRQQASSRKELNPAGKLLLGAVLCLPALHFPA